MRKTPKEILNVSDEERHAWLAEATADELYEFLRWVKADSSWALHGRDALNVVLSKENIKLQTDMRDMTKKMKNMTKWVIGLTIVIAFLTLIQAYPIVKKFFNDAQTSKSIQKAESTTSQTDNENQIKDKNDQHIEEFIKKIREQGYVSGPGGIVGASVTVADRAKIELSYGLHKELNILDKSIQEFNAKSSQLSIVMIVLSIAMLFLGVVQIVIMVKQSSKSKSEDISTTTENKEA
jgi:flagellar basal body-associated protein FliL